MTTPLASTLLDAARPKPTSSHETGLPQDSGALANGEPSLANEPPSRVELATVDADLLAIPEIALILTAAGLLTTAIWAARPHLWQLGTFAAAAVAAAATSLHTISPHTGALVLLLLAAASLAMEVYSLPGLMLHAAGGATALTMAGLCLYGPWSGAHPGVAVPAGLIVGLGTWSAARCSWRASRTDPWAASTRLIGRELVVLHATDGHRGHAVVAGRLWPIRDPYLPLEEGNVAVVTQRLGDELVVQQRQRPAGTTD